MAGAHGAARSAWTAGRIVLTVVACLVAIPFLLGLFLVFGAGLGGSDPHGYALLAGTFLALVAGIFLACLVPWLFPTALRLRVFGLALMVYLVLGVLVGITLANV